MVECRCEFEEDKEVMVGSKVNITLGTWYLIGQMSATTILGTHGPTSPRVSFFTSHVPELPDEVAAVYPVQSMAVAGLKLID